MGIKLQQRTDVVLIQPRIVYPSDQIAGRHQSVRQKEHYIEIGLLSVASTLEGRGIHVRLINMVSDYSIADLRTEVTALRPKLVGVACMSGYAYPALKAYCSLIKELDPKIFTFTGGQHAGPLHRTALEEIGALDCVVRQEGEGTTVELCDAVVHGSRSLESIPGISFRVDKDIRSTTPLGTQLPVDEIPILNYELFPDFLQFVPRVEESRGCPFDCSFCSNASVLTFKVRYKSVDRLVCELSSIYRQYMEPEILRFYLIAKNYGLNREHTVEFAKAIRALPFRVQWRSQTRADIIDPDVIPVLSDAGLRVLDLGLETASPRMLRLMNKAVDPYDYLARAEAIFETVSNLPNTKLKVNLLFHPGETAESLAETLEFLFKWRRKIDAVTAAPVMVDPGAPLWHNLVFFEKTFGTTLFRNAFWDSIHTYPMNPSKDLNFEQSNVLATVIAKMFQTKDAYFETRLFGGVPRGIGTEQFTREMEGIPSQFRPYRDTSRI